MAHEESVAKEGSAARAYRELREMAMMYRFRPGERINEVALAKQLQVSRTPLREALSRLASEGFIESGERGFWARPLDAKQAFDLYELRRELEMSNARFVCERASERELRELWDYCDTMGRKRFSCDVFRQLSVDEEFHERIALLSKNGENLRLLQNINARIRFVRWIDMGGRLAETDSEHRAIAERLLARDSEAAVDLMRRHITRRLDQIVEVIKEGYARIYMK